MNEDSSLPMVRSFSLNSLSSPFDIPSTIAPAPETFKLRSAELHGLESEITERPESQGCQGFHQLENLVRVGPNLRLSVLTHSQVQIVHQVVKVNLPVKFGIGRLGQSHSGLLPAHPVVINQFLVQPVTVVILGINGLYAQVIVFHLTLGPLAIDLGLLPEFLRDENSSLTSRVPRRNLIHTGSSVPEVLAGDEERHFKYKLEIDHFKWGGVPVTHEVSNESFRATCMLRGSSIVRDAGSIHNRLVQVFPRHRVKKRYVADSI